MANNRRKRMIISAIVFFLHECFGITIPFERPKTDNAVWQNWKTQKRDEFGNFCK